MLDSSAEVAKGEELIREVYHLVELVRYQKE